MCTCQLGSSLPMLCTRMGRPPIVITCSLEWPICIAARASIHTPSSSRQAAASRLKHGSDPLWVATHHTPAPHVAQHFARQLCLTTPITPCHVFTHRRKTRMHVSLFKPLAYTISIQPTTAAGVIEQSKSKGQNRIVRACVQRRRRRRQRRRRRRGRRRHRRRRQRRHRLYA